MNISIIIPTYNRGQLISQAIESIYSQYGINDSFKISEIVISDDCSTDNTKSVVESIHKDYPDVIYCKTPCNLGPAGARNEGFKYTSGEWIALLDSDDIWYKNKLQRVTALAKSHPEYQMIYHKMKIVKYDGETTYVPHDIEDRTYLSERIYYPLLIKNFIGAPSMFIKREAWIECGGFDTSFRHLEDWDFALRISKKNLIGFVDEPLLEATMLSGGVSSDIFGWYDARIRIIANNSRELISSGLFNQVVEDLFTKASNRNILDPVSRLLELHLSNISN
ncbi:MAG: glycosyltransferase [Lachnospiraceae bacterium]|nr:glycosyltransferase [Lachnospiraceae bacterium]